MAVLVLFDEDEGLECPEETWGSVDDESVVLGDGEQLPILTELRGNHNSLEIELRNREVPLEVEYNRVPGLINGNEHHPISRHNQVTDLMWGLEGQNLRLVVLEVDFLYDVVQRRVQDLLFGGGETDVTGKVGGSEDVGHLEVVEDHKR